MSPAWSAPHRASRKIRSSGWPRRVADVPAASGMLAATSAAVSPASSFARHTAVGLRATGVGVDPHGGLAHGQFPRGDGSVGAADAGAGGREPGEVTLLQVSDGSIDGRAGHPTYTAA